MSVMSIQTQDGEGQCEVEWWFGEGLSYTSFEYTALEVKPKTIHDGQDFRVGQGCQHTALHLRILRTEVEKGARSFPIGQFYFKGNIWLVEKYLGDR